MHAAVGSPVVLPYRPTGQGLHDATPPLLYVPTGHSVHAPAPTRLYCPAAQIAAVAMVDPAGQAYPSEHGPLHAAVVRPDTDPNVPAGHGAVQAAVGSPGVSPYRPALQLLQVSARANEYVPSPQMAAVLLVDPAAHTYPAVHSPVHDSVVRPVVAPKVPAGHSVQAPAPTRLYCPAAHSTAVEFIDPAGHAYPAEHGPLHAAVVRADTDP